MIDNEIRIGVYVCHCGTNIAATVDVPTLPDKVRNALRQLGLPVRLFGENLANVRERLRMELARCKVGAEPQNAEVPD